LQTNSSSKKDFEISCSKIPKGKKQPKRKEKENVRAIIPLSIPGEGGNSYGKINLRVRGVFIITGLSGIPSWLTKLWGWFGEA